LGCHAQSEGRSKANDISDPWHETTQQQRKGQEADLRVTLLLEVGNDGLPNEVGVPDDVQDLVVLPVNQGELELELGGINADFAGLAVPIERIHRVSNNSSNVERLVKGADDPVVTVGQRILQVVESRVDEDSLLVPGPAFHANSLVDDTLLLEFLVADDDG